MNIQLRKMTAQEYSDFYEYSKNHHAEELMKELNMTPDEALIETEQELIEMLPDGLNTADNFLFVIEGLADRKKVGFMWYLFESTDHVKQVFLCDFVIQERDRRKGYATAALYEMEKHAGDNGSRESLLFVANDNTAAKKLYAGCGYGFLKNGDYGVFLKKTL